MRRFVEKKVILLVDDDHDVASTTGEFLEMAGYEVDYARDGLEGLRLAMDQHYDVIVLDRTMPRMDGIEVCRKLRQDVRRSAPILFLSGRGAVEHRIEGLQAGADDYLVKPFALKELGARLIALVKRHKRQLAGTVTTVGDLTMDTSLGTVKRDGTRLALSPIQFQLLAILMRESPAIVSRSDIEREIWAEDLPDSDTLRSHTYSLRKIIDRPFDEPLLHTIKGLGFRLAALDGAALPTRGGISTAADGALSLVAARA